MPLLVIAEFGCTEDGEGPFLEHLERTLTECRGIAGCLDATVWQRPPRRYTFLTAWEDRAAVDRWVQNPFHREVLMPAFRRWCNEGWFSEWDLTADHKRARKCAHCGRWTQILPGWQEHARMTCQHCGEPLARRIPLAAGDGPA